MERIQEFTVSKDKNGCFNTIYEALNSAKEVRLQDEKVLIKINILDGFYKERIKVDISNLIIEGSNFKNCIISNNYRALEIMDDGNIRGTFRTATLHLDGDNITLRNLTIENSAGNGKDNGQCVALYSDGDNIKVENCILKANQDTLFTAPLPQADKTGSNKGLGPQAIYPRKHCRQLYKDCSIIGNIDFIFGGATALFDNCSIFVIDDNKDRDTKGYIAAPCTTQDLEFGYLFYKCMISGDVDEKSVYLARPWRIGAKAVFIDCNINPYIIKDEVFHDWNKEIAHSTSYFALDSASDVFVNRVNWSHVLREAEKKDYINNYFEYFNSAKPKDWIADIENI